MQNLREWVGMDGVGKDMCCLTFRGHRPFSTSTFHRRTTLRPPHGRRAGLPCVLSFLIQLDCSAHPLVFKSAASAASGVDVKASFFRSPRLLFFFRAAVAAFLPRLPPSLLFYERIERKKEMMALEYSPPGSHHLLLRCIPGGASVDSGGRGWAVAVPKVVVASVGRGGCHGSRPAVDGTPVADPVRARSIPAPAAPGAYVEVFGRVPDPGPGPGPLPVPCPVISSPTEPALARRDCASSPDAERSLSVQKGSAIVSNVPEAVWK
jgi:hypothetical protein